MKETFDLLAEALSLPYSELFLENDLLAECVPEKRGVGPCQSEHVAKMNGRLCKLGLKAAMYANRHTSFRDVDQLQSMIDYVFDATEILRTANRFFMGSPNRSTEIVNEYYILLLKRIAKTFLSSRNGAAVVKYWAGSAEAFPNADRLPSGEDRPVWDRDLLRSQDRPHRIEAWHSLLQRLPESLLLSTYAVCLAETEPLSYLQKCDACIRTLRSFGDTVHIADQMLDKLFEKGLAETHLHGNASRSFDLIWEVDLNAAIQGYPPIEYSHDLVFQASVDQQTYYEHALEAAVLRAILAAFLETGEADLRCFLTKQKDIGCLCSRERLLKTLDLISQGKPVAGGIASAVARIRPFLEKLSGTDRYYLPSLLHLPGSIATADVGFAERCFLARALLYITQMQQAENGPDAAFTAAFLYYLRLKNKLYRYRIQDSKSKGLSYFQRYYDFSTDSGGQDRDTELLHILYTALRDRRIVKTELRFTPPVSLDQTFRYAEHDIVIKLKERLKRFICQHLHVIAALYGNIPHALQADGRDGFLAQWEKAMFSIREGRCEVLKSLLNQYSVDCKSVPPHRLGVLIHFVKMGESPEKDSCFLRHTNGSEREKHAAFSFGRARFYYQAAVQAIRQLRRDCPATGKMLIGIDAASQELPTEPWVFAPAFRSAREPETVPKRRGGEQKLLGLTYHVGEEFRHPLSGLRHIGEAISYFKMHSGDRLGHALALGIDLDYWFDHHRMVAMPRVEWMEDCLWAWETAASLPESSELSVFTKYLEREINTCANEIYGTQNGISIRKLCAAYRSKTLDYPNLCQIAKRWEIRNHCMPVDCFHSNQNLCFFPCAQQACPDREEWWSEDSLSLSYHCSYFKCRMNQEILRELTPQEINLTKSMQAYLRRIVAATGITLEENPSSNAVIGEMDGILSHPICNLRSKDSQNSIVIATINTDDPSVFNSNVANEHALIYYALLHRGHSVEESLKIVDEIREAGVSSSFLSDVSPFETILQEYETMLYQIMQA